MNSISNISSLLFLRSLCKKSVHLQRHILYCILCSGFPWDVDGLELKLTFMAGRCPWLRLFQPQNGSSNSARCSKTCSWGTVKVLVSAWHTVSVTGWAAGIPNAADTFSFCTCVPNDKPWRQDQVHALHSLLHALWTCSVLFLLLMLSVKVAHDFPPWSFSTSGTFWLFEMLTCT